VAEYIASEVSAARLPNLGLFEIVLIGKSNVGKSSFINSFVNMKNLAHTSKQPGKTRTANLYKINNDFCFVDMPGYGYAKTSKVQRGEFVKIIRDYIENRQADFATYFLVDSRHPPGTNDLEAYDWLDECGVTPIMVLTKTDKLKNSEKETMIATILEAFDRREDDGIILYSINSQELIQKARDKTFGLALDA
jgi:GTP-binding protein